MAAAIILVGACTSSGTPAPGSSAGPGGGGPVGTLTVPTFTKIGGSVSVLAVWAGGTDPKTEEGAFRKVLAPFLEATGITEAIETSGRYDPVRPRIWSMDRQTQADEIRRLTASPDVMLGSVHAVTETGSLLTASMGGSQLGPYVSGAGRVILVVGTQKIVSDLEDGLPRIDEYSFPLEDARAQAAYGIHSAVNKVLIINREIAPGRITVVLVDEVLGF